MLSYNEAAAIAAAPIHAPVDAALRRILADRVHDWATCGLLDLTYLVVIEPGDTERDLLDRLGYSPLINPTIGKRFGEPGFTPAFDWLKLNGEYWELIETVSNDATAFCVFIPNSEQTDPELLALCRTYAEDETCVGW